ncbi:MAG TPA: hypothetical protein VHF89_13945 [Solirubrobacteraceae bacterium]|nr:hypothetical protein [Solirubrobacteraceae bacterium]
MARRASIAVLLLPARLEELDQRDEVQALLAAPGVVAIEPGRLPALQGRRARGQARRLLRRLPGRPVAVVVFGEREQALGEAMATRVFGECEVIATRDTAGLRERFAALGVKL